MALQEGYVVKDLLSWLLSNPLCYILVICCLNYERFFWLGVPKDYWGENDPKNWWMHTPDLTTHTHTLLGCSSHSGNKYVLMIVRSKSTLKALLNQRIMKYKIIFYLFKNIIIWSQRVNLQFFQRLDVT